MSTEHCTVVKRNGDKVPYSEDKIIKVIEKAFKATGEEVTPGQIKTLAASIEIYDGISVEEIQTQVQRVLMIAGFYETAEAFIKYRAEHASARFIRERLDYMQKYSNSTSNAASSSETDPNANVAMKNVANLEGEVYKSTNRIIQRQRMKEQLSKLFPEVADQYEKDLENHICYSHDESTTPVPKHYCNAVSLYPLMVSGIGDLDGVTPSPPNDLQSFSGQITNLVFLLSSQCKGAVGLSEYHIVLNYYIIQDFGKDWYKRLDEVVTAGGVTKQRTIRDHIYKAFKQFLYGVNQVAGNRSFQSPFTNFSYFDHTYFEGLFHDFMYPDGTKPEWEAIDCLQRMFMKFFNKLRLTQILTFPVETMCMVYDPETKDIIDKSYKDFTAEMYAEGHSFFTYISNSVDSVSNCCRLQSKLQKNTFNPTSGLTGVMTGSCNVITLNVNHIIQDWYIQETKESKGQKAAKNILKENSHRDSFIKYLITILERVYKYHIAYKTILYELEENGMIASSKAGYISMARLYCTIGINGLNEAAQFIGCEISNNKEYFDFLQLILSTIKEQNEIHSIRGKQPFVFNSEIVPAEGLGGKNYRWDVEDGYWVPDGINLYNSYFYNAHDNTSILDKFILHGRKTCDYTDGGSALHCNLEDHLSKEQYLKLIDFAIDQGTNYFTFNIPNSKCDDCGYITKHPIIECPKCHSKNITQYTRVIGFLRGIKYFGEDRQIEASKRHYADGKKEISENNNG